MTSGLTHIGLVLMLLLVATARSDAQHRYFFGLGGHYELGPSENAISTPEFLSACECLGTGNVTATSTLWATSFFSPEAFGPDFGWSGFVSIGTLRGDFVSDTYNHGANTDTLFRYRNHRTATMLQFNLVGSWHLSEGTYILAGGWFNFPIGPSLAEFERTVVPDPALVGLPAERLIAEGSPRSGINPDLGTTLGVAFEVTLAENVSLFPQGLAHLDLDAVIRGNSLLGALRFSAGTSIMFDVANFFQKRDPPPRALDLPPIDTSFRIPPAPEPPLQASVDLQVREPNGELAQRGVITDERVHYRVVVPMIASLDFERDCDTIRQLCSDRDPKDFSLRDLAQGTPIEIYDARLYLLGLRMRQYPSTKLTIVGSSTLGESRSLAERRANSVRNILHDRFNIAAKRLRVTTERTNRASVRFLSSSTLLSLPITVEWFEQQPIIPPLRIAPSLPPSSRITEWFVEIRYHDELIGRYLGSDKDSLAPGEISIILNEKDTTLALLQAELTVKDSSGVALRATDELPLDIVPSFRGVDRYIWFPTSPESNDSTEEERSFRRFITELPHLNDSLTTISIAPLVSSGSGASPGTEKRIRRLQKLLAEIIPPEKIITARASLTSDRDSKDEYLLHGIIVELITNY